MALADLPNRLILERLAGELTGQQYRVFRLRVVEEMSYQRIADWMDITKPTVYGHYSAALRKIGNIEWENDVD